MVQLARWSEGGLSIVDLKSLPYSEIVLIEDEAKKINDRVKREVRKHGV